MKHWFRSLFLLGMLLIPLGAQAWFGNNDLQYVYARASMGDVYSLKAYVASGKSLDIQDRNGDTPYCMALRLNNQTAVRTLAMAGANTRANCLMQLGLITESMIYSAADDGDTNQLSLWQRHGVSMDLMDEDGNTALCEAVYHHNCPAIDILLKAGANQYHSCFNRIPVEVRRTLDCKTVIRDWSKVGMTLLGTALVGGVAYAAANGGSGGGSLSCGDGEHWNGHECVACLRNQYWDKTLAACVDCPSGTYSIVGALSCTTCPDKNTKFDYDTNSCVSCPSFSMSAGYTDTCTACTSSQIWQDETCVTCGTETAPDLDRTSCISCSASQYYDSVTRQCRSCPDASPYSPGGIISISGCRSCDEDTEIASGGQCKACEEGTKPNSTGTKCIKCSAGDYYDESIHDCTSCPDDKPHSPGGIGGESICFGCTGNTIWQNGACTDCGTTAAPNSTGTKCITCDPGEYYNSDIHDCLECPDGKPHSPGGIGGESICFGCLDTQYWKNGECTNCPTGQYSDPTGTKCVYCKNVDTYYDDSSSTCVDCPDGTHAPVGSIGLDSCQPCADGTYWDGDECTACTTPNADKTECLSCLADYYYNTESKTCEKCETGTHSSGGSVTSCITCTTGTEWDTTISPPGCRCSTGAGYCLDNSTDPPTCRAPKGVKYVDKTTTTVVGEYTDPETGYCMPIAPQATTTDQYNTILASYASSGTHSTEYNKSGALDPINAKYAYARGYTGKIINRLKEGTGYNPYGVLGSGDAITNNRIKVGIIDNGQVTSNLSAGSIQTGYEYKSIKSSEIVTWDEFSDSNPYYINPDLTTNTITQFNFDRGICADSDSTNCYTKVSSGSTYLLVYRDASKKTYLVDKDTYDFEQYTTLSGITASDYLSFTDLFNRYAYFKGYSLSDGTGGNYNNATPHYLSNVVRESEDGSDTGQKITGGAVSQSGTQLAALIGASQDSTSSTDDKGIMGVAFDAQLIPVIGDSVHPLQNGLYGSNAVATLMDEGASVILQNIFREVTYDSTDGTSSHVASEAKGQKLSNNYYESAREAYTTLGASKNTVLVVPTGYYKDNVSDTGVVQKVKDASIDAGAPLAKDASSLLGHFVSVTAVKQSGDTWVLTSDALPCGSTGSYCLAAPGNVSATISSSTSASTYETQAYTGSSTSAAAAVVAGAVAIMQGAYPHLSSTEILEILYHTATPLGSAIEGESIGATDVYTEVSEGYGYSSLYGYGLVNLEAATRPQGPLWVNNGFADGNETSMPYMDTEASVPTAMATALKSVLPTTTVAYDSYSRPFTVSLTNAFKTQNANRYDFEDDFKAFMNGREVSVNSPNDRFTMTYAPRYSSRSSVIPNGLMDIKMKFGDLSTNLFYSEDTLMQGNYFEHVLNNPLIQFQEAYGFGTTYDLNKHWYVGANYVAGKNGFFGDGDKDFEAPDNKMDAFSVEVGYKPVKSVMFKTTYGLMREDESVLGMLGEGNFALSGASTAFVGAGVSLRPTDKFKVDLMYTYGWTNPESTDGLMRLSRLTSDGFALTAQYQVDENQMFGFSFSSPLRVNSGKVSVALPTGRSSTSNTFYSQIYSAPLKPDAREYDISLFYKDKLTEDLSIQSEVGLRLNPDHQSDAKTDYRGMLGLKYKY